MWRSNDGERCGKGILTHIAGCKNRKAFRLDETGSYCEAPMFGVGDGSVKPGPSSTARLELFKLNVLCMPGCTRLKRRAGVINKISEFKILVELRLRWQEAGDYDVAHLASEVVCDLLDNCPADAFSLVQNSFAGPEVDTELPCHLLVQAVRFGPQKPAQLFDPLNIGNHYAAQLFNLLNIGRRSHSKLK